MRVARASRTRYIAAHYLTLLGRRQEVRQRLLMPSFAGSNPAAPASQSWVFQAIVGVCEKPPTFQRVGGYLGLGVPLSPAVLSHFCIFGVGFLREHFWRHARGLQLAGAGSIDSDGGASLVDRRLFRWNPLLTDWHRPAAWSVNQHGYAVPFACAYGR